MHRIIKILGTGCAKCQQTIALVKEVVEDNNIDASVIKVEEIREIMSYQVMTTPAIVIDEVVVFKGRVPAKSEILAAINNTQITTEEKSSGHSCSCGNKH